MMPPCQQCGCPSNRSYFKWCNGCRQPLGHSSGEGILASHPSWRQSQQYAFPPAPPAEQPATQQHAYDAASQPQRQPFDTKQQHAGDTDSQPQRLPCTSIVKIEIDEIEQLEADTFFKQIIAKLAPPIEVEALNLDATNHIVENLKKNRDFCYRKAQTYCRAQSVVNHKIGELCAHAKVLELNSKLTKVEPIKSCELDAINNSDLPNELKHKMIAALKLEKTEKVKTEPAKVEHYEMDVDDIDDIEDAALEQISEPLPKRLKSTRVQAHIAKRAAAWENAGDESISSEDFQMSKAEKKKLELRKKAALRHASANAPGKTQKTNRKR